MLLSIDCSDDWPWWKKKHLTLSSWNQEGKKEFGIARVDMSWGKKVVVKHFSASRWITIWHATEDTLVYLHLVFLCRNSRTLQSLAFLWLSCWACKNRMFKSCPIRWRAVYCSDNWLQALVGFHFLLWAGYDWNLHRLLGWVEKMGLRDGQILKGASFHYMNSTHLLQLDFFVC